jgi:hypothetical protein
MKSSELRIGNITSMGVVCSIEDNFFRVLDSEGDTFKNTWADIQPIPLTEEWLLKFGFIKKNGYGFIKKDLAGNIFYSVETKEHFMFQYHDLRIKIKHVHQLQNIYFALTGEELIFKSEI